MRILILDTTHGGDILAEKYASAGNEVTCADVYHVTSEEIMKKVSSVGAVAVRDVPPGHYDLVIMPWHCPDMFLENITYDSRIFFNEAVNRLVNDGRFRIEVTGVKGKTGTCYLIAHLLSAGGKKVFLHTSRGQGVWTSGCHRIDAKKSIAPTSLLTLPEGDYDVMVCETSLGGSGKADIACITNLIEDYGIAKNTRKAADAKACILSDKINIVSESEAEIWTRYGKPLTYYGKRIRIIGKPEFLKPLRVSVDYKGPAEIELNADYLSLQYLDAMDLALEVCDKMDIPKEDILEGLKTFKGVPGRGEIFEDNNVKHVKERNPGISHISIRKTLECLSEMDALDDAVVILDPIGKKVCDKMDIEQIRKTVSEFGVDIIVTTGDGTRPDIPNDRKMIIEFIKEGFQ